LILRLATLKRRKRRAPSGVGCGGSVRMHPYATVLGD
jgi:hypothetical protein